jgi:hypothetical protein
MSEEKTKPTPNPGSREALALGCTCAVLDNAHGYGYMGRSGTFCITESCPLHGQPLRDALRDQRTHDQ